MGYFFSPVERMLALRYMRSRRAEGFISVIAWFSLAGITLGVATLIVVMSVMNGFRTELVDRVLGINGHLIVYKKNGSEISNYNQVVKKILDNENVIAVTPHLEGQALAKTKSTVSGVIVRGTNWSDLAAKKILWQSLDEISIKNLSKIIAKFIDYKGKIIFDSNYPDGTLRKKLDSKKIYNLGWRPTIKFSEGLQKLIIFRKNSN